MNAEASTSRFPPARPSALNGNEKGKRPAEALPTPQGLVFNVRFTDGSTDDLLSLWVGEREAVRDVKRRIRLLRPGTLASRRLRLIYLGRILTDGVLLVPWTAALLERQKQYEAGQSRLLDDAIEGLEGVVRSVRTAGETSVSEEDAKGKGKAIAKGETMVEQKAIWLNCSVGEVEEPDAPVPTVEAEQVRRRLSPCRSQ